jgi:membrane protease YdiL (CAAX protease family)
MVKSSFGRTLTPKEHIQLASVAVLNAMAEEASSRGFWLNEFMLRGKLSFWHANLCQAISFGVWHYHGIPSGVTGVVLTAVYGFAMGLLHQYGNGLLLPVVAHSIADYFIFAVIARQGGFGSTR